jgi:hypothetical protein
LHRKMLQWEWFTDRNVFHVFMIILLNANHEEKKWKGITIKKGEYLTSLEKLAQSTKLSVNQVRLVLKKLKSTNEITIKTTSLNTLISIRNWEKYQANDKQNDKPITNGQQTDNKPITTTKNYKNIENKEECKERRTIFFETSGPLVESMCMKWGVTLVQLNTMLDDFDLQILAENKTGITDEEYRSYFHNWGTKRFTKYKVGTTQNGMVF